MKFMETLRRTIGSRLLTEVSAARLRRCRRQESGDDEEEDGFLVVEAVRDLERASAVFPRAETSRRWENCGREPLHDS
ncbi:MAG: hypothetical protein R3E89_14500 [Thiolinea sp.]